VRQAKVTLASICKTLTNLESTFSQRKKLVIYGDFELQAKARNFLQIKF